jgi:D-amino-acid dehydrogenase
MAGSFLIVGGGLIGAASALRLIAAGFTVTLIDPGDPRRGASFGNAGHIAAEQPAPHASPETLRSAPGRLFLFGGPLDFRWRDVELWGPWAARYVAACDKRAFAAGSAALGGLMGDPLSAWERLLALANAPDLLLRSGHAVIWMSPKRAQAGLAAWRRASLGPASCREMTRTELNAYIEVMRAPPEAGLMFHGTGQVRDPQAVRAALLADFRARGGSVRTAQVLALAANESEVAASLSGGETAKADFALVAAGAWSRNLMGGLGIDPPLIAERGYSIESAKHSWPSHLPPTVFEERALVVTRFTNGLRASSFLEFGAPDAPGDSRKWRRLSRHLRELGVEFSAQPARWVGPRPTLPDYLPAIGRLAQAPRVFYAFGHQHLGLTLAAATAEVIEALAGGLAPPLDVAPFRVERFLQRR